MKNIVIVSHKFLTQSDDELAYYLSNKKYDNVLHIRHSFSDAEDRCSYYTWYKKGKLFKEERTKDYKKYSEPLIYLKEIYYTKKWIKNSGIIWDYCICMDGFLTYFTSQLKKRYIKRLVFWVIDVVPESRFKSKIKDKIYRHINKTACKKADEIWDLSPRMDIIREKIYGFKAKDVAKHRLVPQGLWTERVKKYSYDKCKKTTLVFMGHLLEKQGAQLVIETIPEIIKEIPNFKFKIIGGGSYKDSLINLAKELDVQKYCDFKGKIEDHKELENEIAKSCVAIAPYIKALDTWTYYADPGKIKTYLGCGVPVLLTNIPWNAEEIEKNKCGIIIKENKKDIIKNMLILMNKEVNQEYRDNAIKYSKSFDYETTFNKLIRELK